METKRTTAKASKVESKAQQMENGVVGFEAIIKASLESETKEMKRLALSGDANAAYHLANLYYLEPMVQNPNKGWKFLTLAAGLGHMCAEVDLGTIYYRRAKGKKDKKAVFDWFMSAAKHGHAEAMMVVSHFYHCGYGCKCDFGKALLWEQNAKNNNFDYFTYLHILGLDK